MVDLGGSIDINWEDLRMQRITREKSLKYLFDKNVPPVIGVDPKERFVVETEDAL